MFRVSLTLSQRLVSSCRIQRHFATVLVKVPPMADSITEGALGSWEKQVGEKVSRDELVANIETDKITLPVNSPEDGVITKVFAQPGDTVTVGQDFYELDTEGTSAAPVAEPVATPEPAVEATPEPIPEPVATPAPATPAAPMRSLDVSEVPRSASTAPLRSETVTRMTPMRNRIAQRLKESQNTAASLTTFNEVDMSALMEMRSLYKDDILKKHGVKFGFMSPFVKASAIALSENPMLNARIEGNEIVSPNYVDISVAVATPKGLVTPILRDCQTMSLIEIEKAMANLAEKARNGQLSMSDLSGGTFTISNGGVFGSLMGTPIINLPQSAILGMHAIKERAVVVNGNVVSRPMMYLALTYDHRIVDGREAVTFLVRLKNLLEDPRRFLIDV